MTENLFSGPWVKFIAVGGVVLLAVMIVTYFKRGRISGRRPGKDAVWAGLEGLGNGYTVLNGVAVRSDQGLGKIDHVVVSPYGIFVVTVRTESGHVRGLPGDREWKVGRRKQDTIYNPLWQNRKHVNALEARLGSLRFIPLVVFVNARLSSHLGPNVVTLAGMGKWIKKHARVNLSVDQQKKVIQSLKGQTP